MEFAGDPGLTVGNEAAAALLLLYRPAFTTSQDPFVGGTEPGEWRPTPGVVAGGEPVHGGKTTPVQAEIVTPVPARAGTATDEHEDAREYDEVKRLGSLTSTDRTAGGKPISRDSGAACSSRSSMAALRAIADAHVPDIGDKARLFALIVHRGRRLADRRLRERNITTTSGGRSPRFARAIMTATR